MMQANGVSAASTGVLTEVQEPRMLPSRVMTASNKSTSAFGTVRGNRQSPKATGYATRSEATKEQPGF